MGRGPGGWSLAGAVYLSTSIVHTYNTLASLLQDVYNTFLQLGKERRLKIPRQKEWRLARVLTQEELAEKANISVRSVAGYEAGAGANPSTVRKLAAALDIDVRDLFEGVSPQGLATPLKEAPPKQWLRDQVSSGRVWMEQGALDKLIEVSSEKGLAILAHRVRGILDNSGKGDLVRLRIVGGRTPEWAEAEIRRPLERIPIQLAG